MKIPFPLVLFATCLMLISCHQSAPPLEMSPTRNVQTNALSQNDTTIKEEKEDDLIYNLVYNLQEVKERELYIDQQTHGKRHLKFMIIERPQNKERNYYLVEAGEDNDVRFVTHFSFYIYPGNNYEIKLYDPVKDTIINLDEWRKENKQLEEPTK